MAISAYSDAEHLIDLINAGINRFITKPINPKNLLDIITAEAENLDNKQMLEHYQQELEEKNKTLEAQNVELERSLRIFENKIQQLSLIMRSQAKKESKKSLKEDEKSPKTTSESNEKKEKESLEYFISSHSNEMEELEVEMDSTVIQMDLKRKLNDSMLKKISRYFNSYATMISIHSGYGLGLLGEKMHQLSKKMEESNSESVDQENTLIIISSLESILYTLKNWREKIFLNLLSESQNEYYDDSMICDINTILLAFDNRANEVDDELELF